jgi:large subunit ribosomal protein L10
MITLEQKKEKIASLVKDIQESASIYLLNYTRLTVEKDSKLRMALNKKGINYRAAKNTLLQRAFNEAGIKGLDDYLVGATAVMFGDSEDPMLPAREIVAFHKENADFLAVKGINLDGQALPGDKLIDLAKMPGRLELIASIVTIVLGPGASLVSVIKGPGSTIAGQIKSLEEKSE